MPFVPSVVGLSEAFEIVRVEGFKPLTLHLRYTGPVSCPECDGQILRDKGKFLRTLRHENLGQRPCFLYLEGRKYLCRSCGRHFRQRFPGILPYRHSTEAFRRQIVQSHHEGISQKTIAHREGLGSATVERWYHDALDRKARERIDASCPRILGIDEHFFTRKNGYATTLCDLQRHRVFDVVLGRSEKALESYLDGLFGKEQVRVVCMDLSTTYRSIARKHFPKAMIVADRFHVIR